MLHNEVNSLIIAAFAADSPHRPQEPGKPVFLVLAQIAVTAHVDESPRDNLLDFTFRLTAGRRGGAGATTCCTLRVLDWHWMIKRVERLLERMAPNPRIETNFHRFPPTECPALQGVLHMYAALSAFGACSCSCGMPQEAQVASFVSWIAIEMLDTPFNFVLQSNRP